MKCPHCEEEIPGSPCPKCGEIVFDDANYCSACGVPLKESVPPAYQGKNFFDSNDDDEDIDFDNRVLCPDGSCTGIMVDGRCTECGRAEGDEGPLKEEPEEAEVEEKKTDLKTPEPAKEKDA